MQPSCCISKMLSNVLRHELVARSNRAKSSGGVAFEQLSRTNMKNNFGCTIVQYRDAVSNKTMLHIGNCKETDDTIVHYSFKNENSEYNIDKCGKHNVIYLKVCFKGTATIRSVGSRLSVMWADGPARYSHIF